MVDTEKAEVHSLVAPIRVLQIAAFLVKVAITDLYSHPGIKNWGQSFYLNDVAKRFCICVRFGSIIAVTDGLISLGHQSSPPTAGCCLERARDQAFPYLCRMFICSTRV